MALREEALYASYRRLERSLYNVLYRQLWQAQDCQDLIHDAFMRVWERRDKVDEATLDALVWTSALNLARNRLRWRALWRYETVDECAEQLPMETKTHDFLAERRLHDALRKLPQRLREVLLMFEYGELKTAQIAQILGIPEGTVSSRRHQALARLKNLLGDLP
ncbi:sigma-70 family RNA polymerase sigma factor [Dyella sp.]|uniref:RNA polymerase sigma factor n=1 Tax=Dyella sp. TaxID=1869338 RepID=UPI002ED60376